jgi:DNA invertase Pin-like site-specific DNA recombinase
VEAGSRAVAYVRVSTTEQGISGLGLDAQESAIRAYADHRQWVLGTVHREVASGAKNKRREELEAALETLGRGDVLVVAKADRLARSLTAYVHLIDRARSEGWLIIAADGSIDLSTPQGRAMSGMSAVFAELEADIIGDRTKAALQAAKARGTQLGRKPKPLAPGVAEDVLRWHRAGESLRTIAARLDETGAKTAAGKTHWHPSTVQRVITSAENG